MTFEADLFAVLKGADAAVGTRVYPVVAPTTTARPYVTWQQIGGDSINPIANDKPGARMAEVHVNVWSISKMEAIRIMRAIEDAMRAATQFTATPISEPLDDYDSDLALYGELQDFRCRHTT